MEQVAQLGIVEQIEMGLNEVVGWVWSTPLVVTLVGVGILFTLILGFPQLKGFIHALKVVTGKYDDPNDPGQIFAFSGTLYSAFGHGWVGKYCWGCCCDSDWWTRSDILDDCCWTSWDGDKIH